LQIDCPLPGDKRHRETQGVENQSVAHIPFLKMEGAGGVDLYRDSDCIQPIDFRTPSNSTKIKNHGFDTRITHTGVHRFLFAIQSNVAKSAVRNFRSLFAIVVSSAKFCLGLVSILPLQR
jgi:hypothetical protein